VHAKSPRRNPASRSQSRLPCRATIGASAATAFLMPRANTSLFSADTMGKMMNSTDPGYPNRVRPSIEPLTAIKETRPRSCGQSRGAAGAYARAAQKFRSIGSECQSWPLSAQADSKPAQSDNSSTTPPKAGECEPAFMKGASINPVCAALQESASAHTRALREHAENRTRPLPFRSVNLCPRMKQEGAVCPASAARSPSQSATNGKRGKPIGRLTRTTGDKAPLTQKRGSSIQ